MSCGGLIFKNCKKIVNHFFISFLKCHQIIFLKRTLYSRQPKSQSAFSRLSQDTSSFFLIQTDLTAYGYQTLSRLGLPSEYACIRVGLSNNSLIVSIPELVLHGNLLALKSNRSELQP